MSGNEAKWCADYPLARLRDCGESEACVLDVFDGLGIPADVHAAIVNLAHLLHESLRRAETAAEYVERAAVYGAPGAKEWMRLNTGKVIGPDGPAGSSAGNDEDLWPPLGRPNQGHTIESLNEEREYYRERAFKAEARLAVLETKEPGRD